MAYELTNAAKLVFNYDSIEPVFAIPKMGAAGSVPSRWLPGRGRKLNRRRSKQPCGKQEGIALGEVPVPTGHAEATPMTDAIRDAEGREAPRVTSDKGTFEHAAEHLPTAHCPSRPHTPVTTQPLASEDKTPIQLERTTCETCDRSLRPGFFPFFLPNGCDHDSTTCIFCWQEWLSTVVEGQVIDTITCLQCNNFLGQYDIRKLAQKETYER